MFKKYVQQKLETYVQKYFTAHPDVKLVIVAGSVGKTTTRNTIASLLSQKYRVRMEPENHNTEISAPLAMLGIELPENLRNPLAWRTVFKAARLRIEEPADVDVVVQEIGVDHPGEMKQYHRYIKADIALVTAIAPEHMEYFKTLDAVAREEMSVSLLAAHTFINRDDIDSRYAELLKTSNFSTYGTSGVAEYRVDIIDRLANGMKGLVTAPELDESFEINTQLIGEHSMRPLIGAVAVALRLGLTVEQITNGVRDVKPVPGRMNLLPGYNNTMIIDDSYNSSPAAVTSAIQTLYQFDTEPQRIVVLGSMNELGETSADEHRKIGEMCSPDLLSWVVVVGSDAEKYLAPAARSKGCQVRICKNAIEAGSFVRSVAEPGAVILVKGSQGGLYLEETVKVLINPENHQQLVRQSPRWMETKAEHFLPDKD